MPVQLLRRTSLTVPLCTAGLVLLAACSSDFAGLGGEPSGAAPPPGSEDSGAASAIEAGRALPPPAAGDPADSSQAVAPAEGGGGSGAGDSPVILKGPDGTAWAVQRAEDEEAYRADIEDCHAYALAQTRRDAQITDDRNAGIDTLTSESRYSALRQRVDEFDLRNRRGSLMTGCMEAKGYVRSDTVLPRLEF